MRLSFKQYFLQLIIILVLSCFAGIVANVLSSQPLPLIRPSISSQPVASSEILDIDLAQAFSLFQKENAIFIDARTPEEYQNGHIRGALNISLQLPRAEKIQMFSKIPPEKIVITYCGQSDCNLSKELAIQMYSVGFQHLRIFFSGWEAWQQAQYPTEP